MNVPGSVALSTKPIGAFKLKFDARSQAFVVLSTITILAGALRLHNLAEPSLWFDELATVFLSRTPPSLLWSDWMVREANPPLYYSLIHVWMAAFGETELSVRMPSVLAGSLNPLLVYAVARALAGLTPTIVPAQDGKSFPVSVQIALMAAFLTAVSARDIASSQEARAYVLAESAALVAVLGMLRLLSPCRVGICWAQAGDASFYVLGCTAALYLHTMMAVLPLVANLIFGLVWITRSSRDYRLAGIWIAANGLCFGLWLWWLFVTIRQLGSPALDIAWIPRRTPAEAASVVVGALFPRASDALPRALSMIGVVLAGIGLLRMPRTQAAILAGFLIGTPLTLYAMSFAVPVLTPRTLLWVQFAATIAVAAGAFALPGMARYFAIAIIGVVALSGAAGAQALRVAEPWRQVVAALAQTLQSTDTVVVADASLSLAIRYYCNTLDCRFSTGRVGQTTRWAAGLDDAPVMTPDAVGKRFAQSVSVVGISYTYLRVEPILSPLADRRPVSFGRNLPPYMDVARWKPRSAPDEPTEIITSAP